MGKEEVVYVPNWILAPEQKNIAIFMTTEEAKIIILRQVSQKGMTDVPWYHL